MKTINLGQQSLDLQTALDLAGQEPVLLVMPDGREFFLAEADDFEREVEVLRQSPAFQEFLDQRSACRRKIPLEEIEKELEEIP